MGKEQIKAGYCHPAYLTYICEMPHEAQAGIKIARGNSNNFRYTDDTTLMAESKEELKSLSMKVEEERERAGWKLNIQKMKIQKMMAPSPITSW